MLKKLKPFVKGYLKETILSPLCVVLEVLLEVNIPLVMADMLNVGIANGDVDYVLKKGALMVGLALLSMLFGFACGRYAAVSAVGFSANLRQGLFSRIQAFSFSNTDKFTTASLMTRATNDVTNVKNAFQMCIRMLFRAPVMLVAATVMAFRINSEMALIFLIAIPILGGSLAVIASKAFPRFQAMLTRYDKMNAGVQETLIAMRVVKAFVRRDYEDIKYEEQTEALRIAQIKAERLLVIASPIMQLTMYACMVAIIAIGGVKIIGGEMLSGDLISFISYIGQILMSLMMIMMVFVMLVMSRASASRIIEVLSETPDIDDSAADAEACVKDGSVDFCDVCFSYSKDKNNLTLENVELHIPAGATVGIIGGTGSSKTTLVQLIPRLYDVTSGCVKVGGRDVRDYTVRRLRDAVSMVLQKNVLFSGTIKENLRWGDPNATDSELTEACAAAQADGFITSFPDGYDTVLGQGGVNLSGGQKQRLCIARAMLKKPKIMILDDSTSAVDTATDLKLRAAMKERLSGTTTIVIAQRVASVMDADMIIVINDGRIVDVGRHDELRARSEIYAEVCNSQLKGVE